MSDLLIGKRKKLDLWMMNKLYKFKICSQVNGERKEREIKKQVHSRFKIQVHSQNHACAFQFNDSRG